LFPFGELWYVKGEDKMFREKLVTRLKTKFEDEIILEKGISYIYDYLISLEIELEEVKNVADVIECNFCYLIIEDRKLLFQVDNEAKEIRVFISDVISGATIAHDRIVVEKEYGLNKLKSTTYNFLNFDEGMMENYLIAAFDIESRVTI
jgi:hypothetical protein